jgi:hypothetical protein
LVVLLGSRREEAILAPSDKTQEQLLARLAAMEAYLAQIAGAVSEIAKRQCDEYDVHVRLTPTTLREPQGMLGPVDPNPHSLQRGSWQFPRGGLPDAFGLGNPPVRPPTVPGGQGDATRIFTPSDAPAAQTVATTQQEPGDFTKYFKVRDDPPPVTPQPDRDEFDSLFAPKR